MKHVNEPPPSVLDVRGDVPLRVAAAVDRALEKDPAQRFPSMDAFAAELEACLAELDRGEDGDATMVIPARDSVWRPPQAAHRPARVCRSSSALLGALAIAAVAVGLLTVGDERQRDPGRRDRSRSQASARTTRSATAPSTTPPRSSPPTATPTRTGRPRPTTTGSKVKKGVGHRARRRTLRPSASRITVVTDTPGFTAEIRATNIQGSTRAARLGQARPSRRTTGSRSTSGAEALLRHLDHEARARTATSRT